MPPEELADASSCKPCGRCAARLYLEGRTGGLPGAVHMAPADAAPPRFGPARALPELNDMVGYLGAAHDAIYGRDVARRTLAAAKARKAALAQDASAAE